MIGFITGHEHNNRVRAVPRGERPGGGRLLAGHDGLAHRLAAAVAAARPRRQRRRHRLDLGHDPRPRRAANPGDGVGSSTKQLASISRELAFNDPDADNGEDGRGDARGGEGDRNVELVVRDPRSP